MRAWETHVETLQVLPVPQQNVDELIRIDILSNHHVAVVDWKGKGETISFERNEGELNWKDESSLL